MKNLTAHFAVWLMKSLSGLPLAWLRVLGAGLGRLLYWLAASRKHVVETNLMLCFPELSPQDRRVLSKKIFIKTAQAYIDRAWLWHGSEALVKSRLKLTGDVKALQNLDRVIAFAPHFVGLDAGGTAIALNNLRPVCSIYSKQSNPVMDAWLRAGRSRFNAPLLLSRTDSPREIARALQSGHVLYLLPDMDFGSNGAVFVPLFAARAATITSLSRFSALAKAQVITVMTRMTDSGYEVNFSSPWENFPTRDPEQDTQRMNHELEQLIESAKDEYYWVHKRFKTRPEGEAGVY